MTGFDIIVLLLIGIGAIGGFLRGFVEEVLSLLAWILTLFVIYTLHTPVTAWMMQYIASSVTASVVAFAALLIVPYAAVKLIANWLGNASRSSILALGYDTVWGVTGRPTWITTARTYPFINTATDELVQMIRERRMDMEERDRQLERPAR